MATASNMMGVGYPAAQATLMGYTAAAVTAAGTTTGAATAIKKAQTMVTVTTAGGADSVRLPSDAEMMRPYIVFNPGATTAQVFPSTGAAINGGSTNAAVNVAQFKTEIFFRVSTNVWVAILTA